MREIIKFRQAIFRDGVFHHWHYWGYLPKDGYSSEDFVAPIIIEQQSWTKTYEVKPSQQCIGLVDKTLITEIYAGDTLETNTGELLCDVTFEDGKFGWNIKYKKPEFNQRQDYFGRSYATQEEASKLKVIGNIYENPKLRERKVGA